MIRMDKSTRLIWVNHELKTVAVHFRAVVLLNLYVIFGVLYNAVRNKASGAELFSHVIVWKALPALVKVGFILAIF